MPTDASNVVSLQEHAQVSSQKARAPDDLFNPITQLDAYRWLTRVAVAGLTDREKALMLFVVDRSAGYGKRSVKTTYRELENGSPGHAGLGKSRSKIAEVIASAKAKGVVHLVSAGPEGIELAPNFDWKPEEAETLPTPKRLAARVRGGTAQPVDGPDFGITPVPETGLPPYRNRDAIIEQHLEPTSRTNTSLPADAGRSADFDRKFLSTPKKRRASDLFPEDETEEVFRPKNPAPLPAPTPRLRPAAKSREEATADRKAAARRSTKPGDLMTTWRLAFEERYRDMPGAVFIRPSVEELGMVRSAVAARWSGSPETLHDYIEFVVSDWEYIRATAFSWMKVEPAPAFPALRFFLRFHPRILGLYSNDWRNRWRRSLDNYEQQQYEAHIAAGKTHKEAIVIVAESRAAAKMREENEKAFRDAARLKREAQLLHDKAQARPVYGVHNPHPKSVAATKPAERPASPPVPPAPVQLGALFDNIPEWRDDV